MDKSKDRIFENHTEQQITIAVNSLLDNLFDKDESLRGAIKISIIQLTEKNVDLVLGLISEFRSKTPAKQLEERTLSILFDLVEAIVKKQLSPIKTETITSVSEMCTAELIKFSNLVPTVQKPIIEVLITLGRSNCSIVMDNILKHVVQGKVIHFMLLHCTGQLATENYVGTLKYMRSLFSALISTLELVEVDHLKQAYSFAIGRFCEAITENSSNDSAKPEESLDFGSEIGIAYDTIFQSWLNSRESKVTTEVLLCLSHMFPLMRPEKITDEMCKIIPILLKLYRRTNTDRVSVTICLAAAIQTSTAVNQVLLNHVSGSILDQLFELICVQQDYDRPHTLKGHFEVLRCFDLLSNTYEVMILEKLLIQMRSNMERDRMKSLILLVHFCNTKPLLVQQKLTDFTKILKQLMIGEKNIKMKMIILKTIVAFAQRGFIEDKGFIKYVIRCACQSNKPTENELAEQTYFMETCKNSIFILSSVGTCDNVLTRELLCILMEQDYMTVVSTATKSLAKLLEKSTEIETEKIQEDSGNQIATLTYIPEPMSVFVRCLILLNNPSESQRANNILLFLKSYAPLINKHLHTLWTEKINQLIELTHHKPISGIVFSEAVAKFLLDTIKDVDEESFSETLIAETIKQYTGLCDPQIATNSEFYIPNSEIERGNLFEILGVALTQVQNEAVLLEQIDIMIQMARTEKLVLVDDNVLLSIAKGFGYVSRKHCSLVLSKLADLLRNEEKKRSSSGFFSQLNFVKENQKEAEIIKIRTIVLESFLQIVFNFPQELTALRDIEDLMIDALLIELHEGLTFQFRCKIVKLLLAVCKKISQSFPDHELKSRDRILDMVLSIKIDEKHLPLLSTILSLGTLLIKLKNSSYTTITNDHEIIKSVCTTFFSAAQQLKTEFKSTEDEDKNSFMAGHLNESLPELNEFVKVILTQNPTPACLDVVTTILETWTKDENSQVRICASHVINAILDVYIKTMQLGCEAPSKFNQTGLMIGKTVPRCIDSNATVRQTSIDILRKVFEISCIYETLTIPDETTDWIIELNNVRNQIVTNESNEILKMANDIARIIASRLSNLQYMHFCRTLLYCINDPEQSSSIGASVVLRCFVKVKGHDLFHTIKEFVPECLEVIKTCEQIKARHGILKTVVALAKHHPQQVCSEMLALDIPFDAVSSEFWRLAAEDSELSSSIFNNFLNTLTTSCLIEAQEKSSISVAALVPLKIFYVFSEMFTVLEVKDSCEARFEELFVVLLTSMPCYINASAPRLEKTTLKKPDKKRAPLSNQIISTPSETVFDLIYKFCALLKLEQLQEAFNIYPNLASSKDLGKFVEMLAPLAVAIGNTFGMNSAKMKTFVNVLSRFTSSSYEQQRITAVAIFSHLLSLNPGEQILSTIMLHLKSAFCDPNMDVQGCAIRGLGNLKYLSENEVANYIEPSLMALINGLDASSGPLINVPIESMRGLCLIISMTKAERLKIYQISLSIRIKPFLENSNCEMRDMTIGLFGQLCEQEILGGGKISEEFQEQVYKYMFPLLLHLGEKEGNIVTSCRDTIRKCVGLMKNAQKTNAFIAENLLDYGQFNYNSFLVSLLKIVSEEFDSEHLQQFLESCLPYFKSYWPALRGNAVLAVAILGNYYNTVSDHDKVGETKIKTLTLDQLSQKIIPMLKDEHLEVRIKAASATGQLFKNI